ncbi:MAG: hypothetical protein KQH63_02330 [Desulfobulbaceae bacterium]|nr:hypothetical protein [Desulfobulbaceae bacterium]
MDILNRFLDLVFYQLIEPLFRFIARTLDFLLMEPMTALNMPIALQITVIAVLTALISFALRRLLKVDSREEKFLTEFASQKKQQENVKYVNDWKSRDALYRTMDNELDEDFNTYLAQRFFRYVSTYMLPIFLVMAWLTSAFPDEKVMASTGSRFIFNLPFGGQERYGLTVAAVFLFAYIVSLFVGFKIKKSDTFRKFARKGFSKKAQA